MSKQSESSDVDRYILSQHANAMCKMNAASDDTHTHTHARVHTRMHIAASCVAHCYPCTHAQRGVK